jgi:isoleucyl-tRNA synthetase
VMKLVSLGHNARQKANRKVRQPLAEAAFSLGRPDERHAVETYSDLITDELNVKKVRLLDTSGEAVSFKVKPLPKQLGQKYGNKFPGLARAITALDANVVAPVFLAGQPVEVILEGQQYSILSEEVEVHSDAKAGFAVAAEGAYLAALVTDLTPELVREGLAREFVRRVQDLRKTADLEVADRIKVNVVATMGLEEAIEANRDYVTAETLTVVLRYSEPLPGYTISTDEFDGEKVTVGLIKA